MKIEITAENVNISFDGSNQVEQIEKIEKYLMATIPELQQAIVAISNNLTNIESQIIEKINVKAQQHASLIAQLKSEIEQLTNQLRENTPEALQDLLNQLNDFSSKLETVGNEIDNQVATIVPDIQPTPVEPTPVNVPPVV